MPQHPGQEPPQDDPVARYLRMRERYAQQQPPATPVTPVTPAPGEDPVERYLRLRDRAGIPPVAAETAPVAPASEGADGWKESARAVGRFLRDAGLGLTPFGRAGAAARAMGGNDENDFATGLAAGLAGQNVADVGAFLETVGIEGAGAKVEAFGREQLEKRPRRTGGLWELKSIGETVDYLQYELGKGIASSVPSLGGAALGYTVGGTPGAVAGAALPSYVQNVGQVRQELEELGVEDPGRLRAIALALGVPLAALDVVMPADLVERVVSRLAARGAARLTARELGKTAARSGLTEAVTEGAQEATEYLGTRATTGHPIEMKELAKRTVEGAVIGGLTGGVMGAGAQVAAEPFRGRVQEEEDRKLAGEALDKYAEGAVEPPPPRPGPTKFEPAPGESIFEEPKPEPGGTIDEVRGALEDLRQQQQAATEPEQQQELGQRIQMLEARERKILEGQGERKRVRGVVDAEEQAREQPRPIVADDEQMMRLGELTEGQLTTLRAKLHAQIDDPQRFAKIGEIERELMIREQRRQQPQPPQKKPAAPPLIDIPPEQFEQAVEKMLELTTAQDLTPAEQAENQIQKLTQIRQTLEGKPGATTRIGVLTRMINERQNDMERSFGDNYVEEDEQAPPAGGPPEAARDLFRQFRALELKLDEEAIVGAETRGRAPANAKGKAKLQQLEQAMMRALERWWSTLSPDERIRVAGITPSRQKEGMQHKLLDQVPESIRYMLYYNLFGQEAAPEPAPGKVVGKIEPKVEPPTEPTRQPEEKPPPAPAGPQILPVNSWVVINGPKPLTAQVVRDEGGNSIEVIPSVGGNRMTVLRSAVNTSEPTHEPSTARMRTLEEAQAAGTKPELVVIPCGQEKLDRKARVEDLYTGQYFRMALAYARSLVRDEYIRVLSAKYGLLRLDEVIEPYDVKFGDRDEIAPTKIVRQAEADEITYLDVFVVGGERYAAAAGAVWPDAVRVIPAGLNIGQQLQRLRQLTPESARPAKQKAKTKPAETGRAPTQKYEVAEEEGQKRFTSSRYAGGALRPDLTKVTTEGLVRELWQLTNKLQEAIERSQYSLQENSQGNMILTATGIDKGGVSKQAKARKTIDDLQGVMQRIEKILVERGVPQEDITQRMLDLAEQDAEREAIQAEGAPDEHDILEAIYGSESTPVTKPEEEDEFAREMREEFEQRRQQQGGERTVLGEGSWKRPQGVSDENLRANLLQLNLTGQMKDPAIESRLRAAGLVTTGGRGRGRKPGPILTIEGHRALAELSGIGTAPAKPVIERPPVKDDDEGLPFTPTGTDLFGEPAPGEEPEQGGLFGGKEGTAAARNLSQTERAAKARIDAINARLAVKGLPDADRIRLSAEKAQLEKLVNRGQAISAGELSTRAAGEEDVVTPPPDEDQRSLFNPATPADVVVHATTTPPVVAKAVPGTAPIVPSTARAAVKTMRKIVETLGQALDLRIRQGRYPFGRTKSLGVYKVKPEIARVIDIAKLYVASHEAGHHVSKTFLGGLNRQGGIKTRIADKAVVKELLDMGRELYGKRKPAYGYTEEGLAELFAFFVVKPDHLTEVIEKKQRDGSTIREPRAARALAWLENTVFPREPILQQAFTEARTEYQRFQTAPAAQRVHSYINIGRAVRLMPSWQSFKRQWITSKLIDDLVEIKRAMQELEELRGEKVTDATRDAYLLARLTRGDSHVIENFLEYGVGLFDDRTNRQTVALRDIINAIPRERLNEFRDYLVAERLLERASHAFRKEVVVGVDKDGNPVKELVRVSDVLTEMPPDFMKDPRNQQRATERIDRLLPGLTWQDVRELVEAGRKDTLFQRQAAEMWKINEALLRYLRDAGLLTHAEYEQILAANLKRVGFYRVFDRDSEGPLTRQLGTGQGFGQSGPGLHRLKGSARDVIDPLEGMILDHYRTVHIAHKHAVMQALATLAMETEGGGRIWERVETPKVRQVMRLTAEHIETLQDYGVEIDEDLAAELEGVQLIAFHERTFTTAKDHREFVYPVMVRGKRVWGQVGDQQVYKALQQLNHQELHALLKILQPAARALRAGAVLDPSFSLGTNPFRDVVTTAIRTTASFKPPTWHFVRGVFHWLKADEYLHAFETSGASVASQMAVDRDQHQKRLAELMRPRLGEMARELRAGRFSVREYVNERVFGDTKPTVILKHPREALYFAAHMLNLALAPLQRTAEVFERANRLGEFAEVYDELRRKGVPARSARPRAAFAARDVTYDFRKAGSVGRDINSVAAFFNAAMLSINQFYEDHRTRPLQTMVRSTAILTIPAMVAYLLQRDDEEYQAAPSWMKNTGLVFVQRDSAGNFVRRLWLPVPHLYGWFYAVLPTRIAGFIDTQNPEHLRQASLALIEQAPNPIPAAAVPILENWANLNLFHQGGRPIVSPDVSRVEPGYQYNPKTGEFSRVVGKQIGYSPAKIENLVQGYGAGLGRIGLQVADAATRATLDVAGEDRPYVHQPGRTDVLQQLPLAGRFARGMGTGLDQEPVQQVFRLFREAEEKYNTYRKLASNEATLGEAEEYFQQNAAAIWSVVGTDDGGGVMGPIRGAREAIIGYRLAQDALGREQLPKEEYERQLREINDAMREIAMQALDHVGRRTMPAAAPPR